MTEPTKLEMAGLINTHRMEVFAHMPFAEFEKVPPEQRCGAYRWLEGYYNALMKVLDKNDSLRDN